MRQAIPDHGRILLVERVVAGPNEGRAAKWSDLNMLVSPGGRERTEAEYGDLLARAGFRATGIVAGPMHSFVEAVPA